MAFLIDTGTELVKNLVYYTVGAIGHQVSYLIFYNTNVKSLQDKLSELVTENERVEQILVKEKRNLKETDDAVANSLIEAKNLKEEVNDILNKRKEKLMPVCGVFPNLVVRHQISRKSTKLVSDVAELCQKMKDFKTYAHEIDPQDVPSKDYEAFSSRTKLVDDIMDYFRKNPDDNLIGVVGLGGIGKTTLVKEVARQATRDKTMFADVALVDVKQDPTIQRIQKEIAEKLGLEFKPDETQAGRARRLSTRIKDKNTLVILDDVWDKIDLEAVGISGAAACKVLLTSRDRSVLSVMQTQKVFQLKILKEEEAWNLFKKKAGDVVEDPSIKVVATKVAKKCGGLPVLVVTVASALRDREVLPAWNDALRSLKLFGKEEGTEKVYLTLEWSYSQLKNDELKQAFLLCGLLADSLKIFHISYVFKYAIGLGFFKDHKTLGEAWAAVNTLFEKLKDSCLLLEHEDEGCLKMHDVVYDVANRISSRDHHMLKILDGDEFREWPENKDFYDKCTMISLLTSNIPKLPQVLQCKELKFFYMNTDQQHHSLDIPRDFFKETGKLGVLDLTGLSMPSLPSSIQFLKNLKTLCLDHCILGDIALIGQLQQLEVLSFQYSKFKELPKEVGQLTNLRSLDLTCCNELEQIAPGVISNLKMLEELKMGNSFNKWEADGEGIINNEKSNASLWELKCLSKLSILHIHILDANILPRDLFSNALERFQIYIGADWKWNRVLDENVNVLKIKLTTTDQVYRSGIKMLLKRTNELHLDGMEGCSNAAHQLDGDEFQQLKYLHVHNAEYRNIINGKDVLSNLQKLVVSGLENSKFFLSASEARRLVQLTHLQISECPTMEGIVSMNESDENHMRDIFSKLQHLELKDLPSLTKFFSRIDTGYQSLEILQPDNNEIVEVMKSGADIQNSFFNEKVVFPSMKTLIIDELTKLITVWHHQHSPESFKNIETVKISGCPSLETVFPISMVTSLKNLLHLEVERCGVEQIIADGIQTTYEFVFPKVISFKLMYLPNLKGFYNKMHVSLWPSLQELVVEDCSKVAFLAQECSNSQRNYESRNPAPTNQALFSIRKDVFSNLQKLVVSGLENSKFFLSASEASRLVQVTHLQISNCPTMEGIVSTNESGKNLMMDIFSKLQHLELKDLPSLTKYFSRIDTGYQSLEILQPDNNEIVEVMKSGADIQNSFFNEKVAFPSMKTLIINGLTKLITVWHHQHSPESFKSIETVKISGCPSLETVFPISMVASLKNLLHLKVKECGVEQIIADGIQTPYEFVFPKVISFKLKDLLNLNGFYNKKHVSLWPSLQRLVVEDCSKVAFLAQECSSLQRNYESRNPAPTNQALFSISKDSFPNLKSVIMFGRMEIMDSDFPSIYFTNLEVLLFGSSNAESAAIFDNSTGLRNYGETSAPAPSEIYSHAERRIDEIPSVGTLTHLSRLYLNRLPCLMHLGNDSSQGIAGPNIPNLKYLSIGFCHSLRNLRSSAVSFKNLTELEVFYCSGLEYLITFSTAKHLNQLTNLSVKNCARLVEIVRITEDDDNAGNEIVFSRLKYLKLSDLPGLQTFCSRDCTVEFPSLEELVISKRLKSKIFHHDETLQVTGQNADTDVDDDDAEAGVQADDGEKVIKEDVNLVANVGGEQSDITTNIITEQEHVQPLQVTANDQDVIAPIEENLTILPVVQVTTHVFPAIEPSLVTQVTHNDELLVEEFFSDIESLAEEAIMSDLHETPGPSAPVQHIKEQSDPSEPSSVATRSSMKSFGEKWSLVVVLFAVLLGICITLISLPHLRPGSRICTSVPLCHVINPFFHHLTSHQKHVHEPLEVDTNRGLITPVEENLAVVLEGQEIITRVLLNIEHPPVAEVPQTETSRPDNEKQIDEDDAKAGVQADDGEKLTEEDLDLDASVDGEQSDITTNIITEQDNVQPLQITATDQDVIAPIESLTILPVAQVTTHVFPAIEPSLVTQVTHNDELLVEEFFSDIESLAEEAIMSDLHETPDPSAPVQHIKEQSDSSEPSSVATRSSMKSFWEKWSLIVVLFTVLLGICILLISLPHLRPGSRICTSVPLCHVINPFFHHLTSHQKHVHEPLEVETDQGLITPVKENLVVALEGQNKITRVLLDIEHPPVAEVPQTEASRPDDEKQIDLYETSASTSSRKSFEAKRSLREKLQAMSAKRTSSSSGPYEEAKSKLKALIATADLKDYHTRQQLLEILPALQISTTKWIADLAVQELAKLQLVMDKEQSLSAELAAHISQGSELDIRSQKLLSEGSEAEQNIHKVEEHKADLLALREQIKKLEAQATSLEDEITVLENKHFGFEASLDELDEEHQVNQGYVESTSQELLRTQAESASLSTAIFTYVRQLL